MPQEEEASTQKLVGEAGGGFVRSELQKSDESWERHQLMSARTHWLGILRTKGNERKLKEAAKQEREGRCEHPSGTANEQWTRVPTTDSTSFLENFCPTNHSSSFSRYHVFLAAGIWTVFIDKFQVKPKYLNSEAKGLVLDSFQGQPRRFARS